MEKFNPNKTCDKCGFTHAKTEHHNDFGYDFLRRICGRCNYSWREACIDHPVRAGQDAGHERQSENK